jgi:hypothetical protein
MKLIVEHGARKTLNCTEHNKESWIQKCNATTQMKYRESNEEKNISIFNKKKRTASRK